MAELSKTLKDNPMLASLFAIVLGGGGFNIISESGEEEIMEQFVQELREADIIQDNKYDDLLQRYNDMNTDLKLIEQRLP